MGASRCDETTAWMTELWDREVSAVRKSESQTCCAARIAATYT